MTLQTIDGNQALAWGAIEAGVSLVTGYPGSPTTATFQALAGSAAELGHRAEWCLNERIALDMAAGASQGGRRALVCLKSVGMNVALDTLMTLNLTGVHAGLVILLGDDPGAWGSQNEQDTRLVAPLAELPLLEPATPEEGRRMIRWAFDFSETLQTVVIIRLTRSFSRHRAAMPPLAPPPCKPLLRPNREPLRWIAIPRTAVEQHRRLHHNLAQIAGRFDRLPFNGRAGSGAKGILAGGYVYTKLHHVLAGVDRSPFTIFKLGTLYPLPAESLADFLRGCAELLVLEEVDPYLEDAVKRIGYDIGLTPRILGKRSGHVNWEGELLYRHLRQALNRYVPGLGLAQPEAEVDLDQTNSTGRQQCDSCRYVEILTILREEARALGQNPFLAGDPGCLVTAADLLDIKLSMGSAIGVAAGLCRAGVNDRVVAVFGDSAFFHGGLNALIQARATSTDLLILLLDNGGAVTTGGQPTPDRGLALPGGPGPVVSIRQLAESCGVAPIWEVEAAEVGEPLRPLFRQALQREGLAMVILRRPCNAAD